MQFDNRAYLFACRLLFPQKTRLIYKYKGLEFETDHAAGDATGAREVLTTPMYRQYLPRMRLVGPLNVLDIGGNNGGFPLLLASEGFDIERVVSVELNPKTYGRLKANLERNFGSRAQALNLAVCVDDRDIPFTEGPGSVSDNIYTTAAGVDRYSTTIRGVSLDSLIESTFGGERIDVCKIDIEGAEFEIFSTNNHTRIAQCRYLLIEIHHEPSRDRASVIARITATGFVEINGEEKVGNSHFVHLFANISA